MKTTAEEWKAIAEKLTAAMEEEHGQIHPESLPECHQCAAMCEYYEALILEPATKPEEPRPTFRILPAPIRTALTEHGERIPPIPGDRPCAEYDPAGAGAGLESDGCPQCANCGYTKALH